MAGFAASIRTWSDKTKRKVTEIYRQSIIELVREMQTTRAAGGNMPVDTGYLRASIQFSTTAMPHPQMGSRPVKGGTYSYNDTEATAFAGSLRPGQTAFIGYTAEYANIQEYQTGFVRLAAQNWDAIVQRTAQKVRAR